MTIAERHAYILNQLNEKGYVRVADLADALSVSLVTIRKDLKILESRQLLFRSHGSASIRKSYANERPVEEKETIHALEKQRIGQKAVELLQANEAIIIGSGTTALAFARGIPNELPLIVLTGAMNVSLALMEKEKVELMQLGGIVRKSATSVVGPFAEEMLQHFACTQLFLGVDGISLDYGLTTSSLLEAHLNQRMIQAVEKTIVLCDSSKFSLRGFGKIGEVEDIDVIITDTGVATSTVTELEDRGVEVWVV
ncbi:MAG: DeoR/GlpR family DNA-binding transcription regulator [Bacteroidota bacterium]